MPRVAHQTARRHFLSQYSSTHNTAHQGGEEFGLMWKYIDEFIDYTKGRKLPKRPDAGNPHSRNVSSVTHNSMKSTGSPHHGRTISKATITMRDIVSPNAMTEKEPDLITGSHNSFKGELKNSYKQMKSKITEAISTSDNTRQRDIREAKSRAEKAAISTPVLESPGLQHEQMKHTPLQRPEPVTMRKEAASGTQAPIRRKPLSHELQRETLRPSPKHDVKVAQSPIHQSSVHVVKHQVSDSTMKGDKRLKLQANRKTKMARTTRFGDFMTSPTEQEPLAVPEEDTNNVPMPVPTGWLADHVPPYRAEEQNDDAQYQEVETKENERSRQAVKSEWLAASRGCVLQRPLDIRDCDFCGGEFDPESFLQTSEGQLCGDCAEKMGSCFACKKTFGAGFEQRHMGQICADCISNIRPCDFCGKKIGDGFEQTPIGWLCGDCVCAKTPVIIPPSPKYPGSGASPISWDMSPSPPPNSAKRSPYAVPSDFHPEPRLSDHPAFRPYPERSASLANGVSSSIRQSTLKRNRSPLSMVERMHRSSASYGDDVSALSDGWDTDVLTDDDPVSPTSTPDRSRQDKMPSLPPIKPTSPLRPQMKRVASSCYPEDEIQGSDEPKMPLPPIPAKLVKEWELNGKYNVYDVPESPYDGETLHSKVYRKPSAEKVVDRSTYYDVLTSYQR